MKNATLCTCVPRLGNLISRNSDRSIASYLINGRFAVRRIGEFRVNRESSTTVPTVRTSSLMRKLMQILLAGLALVAFAIAVKKAGLWDALHAPAIPMPAHPPLVAVPDSLPPPVSAYCSMCHAVPHPQVLTQELWPQKMQLMFDLMEQQETRHIRGAQKGMLGFLRRKQP